MKIRTAIFGVYVAASAVGFLVMMAFVLRDVRLRYIESMRRTLGDTAVFLGSFVAPKSLEDPDWATPLGALPAAADLLRVYACDRNGRVLFDSAGRDVGQHYSFPMRGGGRVASENYTVSNVAEVGGELRVAATVRFGGEVIGLVGVGRPLASVTEGVSKARTELIWSLGSIAAVMVAAGWWISSRLTHSLERLTAYAQAVSVGEAAVPPPSRAKEIAALSHAFEEMRIALEGKAYVERYTQALTHEFKAPLSALRGAAELLAENPPEADRLRFVANVRAETERLRRIVDRLLELAALETKRAGATMAEVDLHEIARQAAEEARAAAELRGVNLQFTSNPDTAVRVRGDEFLLGQALDNLVQNALEFTPRGGSVAVNVATENAQVMVRVEDTGPGVPEFALEKVFERFYSLPRPDTGRKSSGLGLSIVREVARLHRGDVTLTNRPGGGARALFSVPLA